MYAFPYIKMNKYVRVWLAEHAAHMAEKHEGKRLGRSERWWEVSIIIVFRKLGYRSVDWIHLAQDRAQWRDLANKVMNLRVQWNASYFLCSWAAASFGRAIAEAGFAPRRPGFNPGSGQVIFVVDKVASRQAFYEYFGFPCYSFHQILHPHNHPGQVQ
jgi:hypothetical protein